MKTHYIKGSVDNGHLLAQIPEVIFPNGQNIPIKFNIHIENSQFVIKLVSNQDNYLFRGLVKVVQNFLDEIQVENELIDNWEGFQQETIQATA